MARVRPHALLLAGLLLLAGCQPPPSPDAAVVADLRAGVESTLDAMRLPAEQRPSGRALDDSVGLLSIQSPPERQALIRSGRIGADAVVRTAREQLFLFARQRPGLTAPAMLSWLAAYPEGLTTAQLLVLDALTSQLEREARLQER